MDVKIDEIVKQVIKEVQNGASGNDTVKDGIQLRPDARIQPEGKGAFLTGPENYEIQQFELPVPGKRKFLCTSKDVLYRRQMRRNF